MTNEFIDLVYNAKRKVWQEPSFEQRRLRVTEKKIVSRLAWRTVLYDVFFMRLKDADPRYTNGFSEVEFFRHFAYVESIIVFRCGGIVLLFIVLLFTFCYVYPDILDARHTYWGKTP